MNIHFNDKTLFESLIASALVRVEIGSKMYKLNHEKSDVDYLYILPTSTQQLNSFQQSYHQLQYIEDGVDHNFISLHQFLRNALSGDSTINLEVLYDDSLKDSVLSPIYEMRDMFANYKIVRSYLGLARRDGKAYFKQSDDAYQQKRLIHIIRGYYFAKSIINHNFKLVDDTILEEAKRVREISNPKARKEILSDYLNKVDGLRNELNEMLNNKTLNLPQYMNPSSQKLLDVVLDLIMNSETYIEKQKLGGIRDLDVFYNANENWVSYE